MVVSRMKPIKCVVRYDTKWVGQSAEKLLLQFDCVLELVPAPLRPYSDRPSDFRMIFRDYSLGWHVYRELRYMLKSDQISVRDDSDSDHLTITLYGRTLCQPAMFEKFRRIPELKIVW